MSGIEHRPGPIASVVQCPECGYIEDGPHLGGVLCPNHERVVPMEEAECDHCHAAVAVGEYALVTPSTPAAIQLALEGDPPTGWFVVCDGCYDLAVDAIGGADG